MRVGYILLSLRRSTINVENVVVRLWQSSAMCLRAITPAVLFYLLDRHALLAMTMGSKCGFLGFLATPPSCSARHPPRHTGGGGHSGVVLFGNIVRPPRRAKRATSPQRGTLPRDGMRSAATFVAKGGLFHEFCTNKKIVMLR